MTTNIPLIPEKPTHKLTQSYLKSILSYDPETGVFTWKERQDVPKRWNTRYTGKQAGWKDKRGYTFYRHIEINGKKYRAHSLAWLYMTGEFPEPGLEIDHIDGNGLNNRFNNLRLATRGQNKANSRVNRNNKLAIKGVCKFKNRYKAQIWVTGTCIHLGYFDTPEEASAAYGKAAEKHFGDYARA